MGNGEVPKVLVMLKNKPLILYLLDEVSKINQLAKPIIVVGYKHEKVEAVLGDGYIYALQAEQKGTAHAVLAAKGKVRAENILVLYGDVPFLKAESLKRLIRLHYNNKSKLTMFTTTVPNFQGEYAPFVHFGRIIRGSAGSIIKITEYKDATEEERKIKEVNPGIYMFNTKWLWENIGDIRNNNAQGEYYLTDMIEAAIKQDLRIESLPIDPKEVLGINTIEQLRQAENLV